MNEKKYKKRLEFQNKIISRQSEHINHLNMQIEDLKLKCEEKDKLIKSVDYLKDELTEYVEESKKYNQEYKALVKELRLMKEIINQEVYKGRWRLVRFLIK